MKIFNKQINLKKTLILIPLLALANGAQLLILHTVRLKGDIDFYRYDHHLAFFTFSLASLLSTKIAWNLIKKDKNTFLRTIKAFLLSCLFFIAIVLVVDCFFLVVLSGFSYNFYLRFQNTLMLMIIVHLYISSFTLAFLHFKKLQKTALELERIAKERSELQSQILQKNLEPHFLFNNLSVLSGLAKNNPDKIDDFIDDFSDVYRYYLNQGKKQSVHLKDELSFLANYMNLMKERFGEVYQVINEIENIDGFIIPCALQLCVENAIKHNKANNENPLLIQISREGNVIYIKNKLNKVDFTIGTKTGNKYLEHQYKLVFNKKIIFKETNDLFIVEIPVIS